MEASSVGLELDIYLSSEELIQLKTQVLEGILNFREINSDVRKSIPLSLRYIPGRSESVEVNTLPSNCYFGDTRKINIEIQDYLYSCLVENESYGDRFLMGGKVLILQ